MHLGRDCLTKMRDETHVVQAMQEDTYDTPALFMDVCVLGAEQTLIGGHVLLNEENTRVRLGNERE